MILFPQQEKPKLAFHLRELQFTASAPLSRRFSFHPFVSFHPLSRCSIPFGGTVRFAYFPICPSNPVEPRPYRLYYVSTPSSFRRLCPTCAAMRSAREGEGSECRSRLDFIAKSVRERERERANEDCRAFRFASKARRGWLARKSRGGYDSRGREGSNGLFRETWESGGASERSLAETGDRDFVYFSGDVRVASSG